MNEILSVVLAGMQADLARAERVAMNLANAQTPGYKREFASAPAFAARMAAADAATLSRGDQGLGHAGEVHVDHRPGTLKTTGQPLDLAIVGEGWFEVATDHGPAYTRQGNFRLDSQGRLVTQQGHPVLGLSGEIQLLHGSPVIDGAGRVFEGAPVGSTPGKPSAPAIAQLKVVRFEGAAPLQRLGDGLVQVRADPVLAGDNAVQVQQGALENSNVNPIHEMVRLMETVRHLETLQRVAIGYDEMLASSIRRLGEP